MAAMANGRFLSHRLAIGREKLSSQGFLCQKDHGPGQEQAPGILGSVFPSFYLFKRLDRIHFNEIICKSESQRIPWQEHVARY